jgi:hypothetical protein
MKSLSMVILSMLPTALSIHDAATFWWITPPLGLCVAAAVALVFARQQSLRSLQSHFNLRPGGQQVLNSDGTNTVIVTYQRANCFIICADDAFYRECQN